MELWNLSKKTVIDPICGMKVDPCKTELTADYENKRFYFCAEGCLEAFKENPAKYSNGIPARKKGIWGRYLDRLNKSTDGKAMKCH
jgi:YHS domain-containing protein